MIEFIRNLMLEEGPTGEGDTGEGGGTATADETSTEDAKTEETTDDSTTTGTILGDADDAKETPDDTPDTVPGWMKQLPDELQQDKTLARFQGENPQDVMAELAKSYVEIRGKVGADTVKLPGKNASQEEINAYREAKGVPEKAEEYELPTEGLPEGIEIPENQQERFKGFAHKLGLSPQEAGAAYREWASYIAEDAQQHQQSLQESREKASQELKESWGTNTEQRVEQLKWAARKAAKDEGLDEARVEQELFNNPAVANNPVVLRTLGKLSDYIKEDEIQGGGKGSAAMSRQDAGSRIEELRRDEQFMADYRDPSAPGYDNARREMRRLYEIRDAESQ